MSLKHPERSKPVIILANIFCIIPYYDFKKQKLAHKNLFKLHGLLLGSIMAVVVSYSQYWSLQKPSSLSPLLSTLQFFMVTASLFLFLAIVLGNSFCNMEPWERMLKLLYHKEHAIKGNRRDSLNFPFIYIIIGSVYVFILFAFTAHTMGLIYADILLHIAVLHYAKLIEVCLMYTVITLLRSKYKIISCNLDDINSCVVIQDDTVKKLRELKRIYLEGDSLVKYFNIIFGWPMLLFLAESVQIMLFCSALLTERSLMLPTGMALSSEVIVLNWSFTILAVVSDSKIIYVNQKLVNLPFVVAQFQLRHLLRCRFASNQIIHNCTNEVGKCELMLPNACESLNVSQSWRTRIARN